MGTIRNVHFIYSYPNFQVKKPHTEQTFETLWVLVDECILLVQIKLSYKNVVGILYALTDNSHVQPILLSSLTAG